MIPLVNFFSSLDDNPLVMKAVAALLILLVGFVVGRVAYLVLRRVLHEIRLDKHVRKTFGYRWSLERQLSNLLSMVIYAITIFLALNKLGVVRYLVIGISVVAGVIIIISLLLSLKDLLPNLFAGIHLLYYKPFVKKSKLRVRMISGVVVRVGLLTTSVKEKSDVIIVPNRLLRKEGFKVIKK